MPIQRFKLRLKRRNKDAADSSCNSSFPDCTFSEEATYVGVLFILNGIGSAAAAIGIYLQRGWGWWLGALIAAGSIISYFISRTIGLPATHVEEWNTIGIISVVIEAAFILAFLPAIFNQRKS